jgi:hypothetical protein
MNTSTSRRERHLSDVVSDPILRRDRFIRIDRG